MKLIRGRYNLSQEHKNCVVTIGNFDGVHLGHQSLLKALKNKAKSCQTKTMVISFEPLPYEYFHPPQQCAARLMRLREKIIALKKFDIDYLLCLPFNKKFASLSAEDFISQVLQNELAIQHIIVGDDFKFGAKRTGDVALLKKLGSEYHFTAEAMPTYKLAEQRVSSSRLRAALQDDQLDLAEQLLGNHYAMAGRVAHGSKLGRKLGFPTANIHLHRRVVPIHGIYVVQAEDREGNLHKGVANVGNRPAIGGTKTLLEVHLFDFDQDIYGQQLFVTFLHKLRNEENYESLDLLKIQIAQDVLEAKAYF